MQPLNPSERVTLNGLGYLDNNGPDSLFQLTDGQFHPSKNSARRRAEVDLMIKCFTPQLFIILYL
jgi:hypothetical protein